MEIRAQEVQSWPNWNLWMGSFVLTLCISCLDYIKNFKAWFSFRGQRSKPFCYFLCQTFNLHLSSYLTFKNYLFTYLRDIKYSHLADFTTQMLSMDGTMPGPKPGMKCGKPGTYSQRVNQISNVGGRDSDKYWSQYHCFPVRRWTRYWNQVLWYTM